MHWRLKLTFNDLMVYINFVEHHCLMLHVKFQNLRPPGSGEEDFYLFIYFIIFYFLFFFLFIAMAAILPITFMFFPTNNVLTIFPIQMHGRPMLILDM